MIVRVELVDGYSVIVENDPDTKKTQMGVEQWQLMFARKSDVEKFITLLQKGLEFWEYDKPEEKGD